MAIHRGFLSLPNSPETRMNKSSTNSMKDNIMRVPDDLRNKNLSEESFLLNFLLKGKKIIPFMKNVTGNGRICKTQYQKLGCGRPPA